MFDNYLTGHGRSTMAKHDMRFTLMAAECLVEFLSSKGFGMEQSFNWCRPRSGTRRSCFFFDFQEVSFPSRCTPSRSFSNLLRLKEEEEKTLRRINSEEKYGKINLNERNHKAGENEHYFNGGRIYAVLFRNQIQRGFIQ